MGPRIGCLEREVQFALTTRKEEGLLSDVPNMITQGVYFIMILPSDERWFDYMSP